MRQRIRVRYTATMDPATMARLDSERGNVIRSRIVEASVLLALEFMDNMKKMKERYDQAFSPRRRPAQ